MTLFKVLLGNKMMKLAIGLYLITAFVSFEKFVSALGGSVYYFKEMLLIMPVVFMMTVLIEVWVPKAMISKSLGEKSGAKGVLLALVLGSISAGPIYAAFPITKALLKKGAGVMNVVIILSAWAVIKVPMLANEARFLGGEFMLIRWILTVIVIVVIGYVASRLVKPDQMISKKNIIIEPHVDEKVCIGCQLCIPHGQGLIEMKGQKAFIHYSQLHDHNKHHLIKASEVCPVSAIQLP
jgi:uncharacterized membrane protein YraQ (UPF0718 family)